MLCSLLPAYTFSACLPVTALPVCTHAARGGDSRGVLRLAALRDEHIRVAFLRTISVPDAIISDVCGTGACCRINDGWAERLRWLTALARAIAASYFLPWRRLRKYCAAIAALLSYGRRSASFAASYRRDVVAWRIASCWRFAAGGACRSSRAGFVRVGRAALA